MKTIADRKYEKLISNIVVGPILYTRKITIKNKNNQTGYENKKFIFSDLFKDFRAYTSIKTFKNLLSHDFKFKHFKIIRIYKLD